VGGFQQGQTRTRITIASEPTIRHQRFPVADLDAALASYAERERRFGR